jgi:hypothetical protein
MLPPRCRDRDRNRNRRMFRLDPDPDVDPDSGEPRLEIWSRNAAKCDSPRQRLGNPGAPWTPALKGPDIPDRKAGDGRSDRGMLPAGGWTGTYVWRHRFPSHGSAEWGIPVPPLQGGWRGVPAKPGRCPGLSHRAPSGQVPDAGCRSTPGRRPWGVIGADRHSAFGIRHSSFVIRHSTFPLAPPAFPVLVSSVTRNPHVPAA